MVDPLVLARDSVALLERGNALEAPPHTREAAGLVRVAIERQLRDADRVEALSGFDADPAGPGRTALVEAVAGCARDDPDFGRDLLVGINRDVPADPATGTPAGRDEPPPALRFTFPPAGYLVVGLVLLAGGIGLFTWSAGDAASCDLDVDEGCGSAKFLLGFGLFAAVAGGLLAAVALTAVMRRDRT